MWHQILLSLSPYLCQAVFEVNPRRGLVSNPKFKRNNVLKIDIDVRGNHASIALKGGHLTVSDRDDSFQTCLLR